MQNGMSTKGQKRKSACTRFFPRLITKGQAQLPGPPIFDAKGLGNQRLEAGVPLEEFEILDPAVEPEDVARALDDQVDQHAAIDEVIVDDEVVGVLDEWPIHVCEPVDDHQHHAEAR